MAESARESFERILALAVKKLTDVKVSQEMDSTLALLTVEGFYQDYRVVMKETLSSSGRRYSYYILFGERVMLGLDNHADRKALRLKYGDEFINHLSELIPHRHEVDKLSVTLTPVWTGEQFLEDLESLIVELKQLA